MHPFRNVSARARTHDELVVIEIFHTEYDLLCRRSVLHGVAEEPQEQATRYTKDKLVDSREKRYDQLSRSEKRACICCALTEIGQPHGPTEIGSLSISITGASHVGKWSKGMRGFTSLIHCSTPNTQ